MHTTSTSERVGERRKGRVRERKRERKRDENCVSFWHDEKFEIMVLILNKMMRSFIAFVFTLFTCCFLLFPVSFRGHNMGFLASEENSRK